MSYPYLPAQLDFRVMSTTASGQRRGPEGVLTPSGRYTLLRELGRGGEGSVLAARDATGRRVAFKRLLDADHPDARARFRREAEITRRLAHDHVVPVWGVGADIMGRPYYSMPWLEGGETLRDVLDQLEGGRPIAQKRYPLERRIEIVRRACTAVAHAHAHGVTHRDLKPEHILIGRDDEVYVIDWGLAYVAPVDGESVHAHAQPQGTGPDEVLGTPLYMAPEQLRGYVDPRIDVYALSAILYEAVTLRHYLGDPSWDVDELWVQIIRHDPFPPELAGASAGVRVPSALAQLCLQGLAKNPALRPADAGALGEVLEAWQRGSRSFLRSLLGRFFRAN